MRFTVEQHKMDLGETSIENIFLNQYLQLADGDHLKVYLFAYQNAKNIYGQKNLSNEQIAEALNLKVENVKAAWNYWMSEGIVKKEREISTGEEVYAFLSMRELYLGIIEPYEHTADQGKYIPQNSNEIREMYEEIEKVLGLDLTPNEYERILDHMNDLGQTPDLIVKGFQYCAEHRGKKNLNYVLGVLRNWHLDGINTISELNASLEKAEKRKQNLRKKRRYYKPRDQVEKKEEGGKKDSDLRNLFQKKFIEGMSDKK
ncbi:MAG: DnaD domain protein [Gallicola sp.]|nr:DnaD domain protein [Gallicola sp.]